MWENALIDTFLEAVEKAFNSDHHDNPSMQPPPISVF